MSTVYDPMMPPTRLDRAFDAAVEADLALPPEMIGAMEMRIRANPERFPAANKVLRKIDRSRGVEYDDRFGTFKCIDR
jgi:hypothetical protein